MGCDGGTIPRRDELVRQKKKPEQKDKNAANVAKWKHCAITQDPLRKPIVSCELGRLYNKVSVLEHILNKDKATTSQASHITKLSDVKQLNLTEKAGFEAKKDQKGDVYVDFCGSRYICPVTGVEMNGRQRFYLMWQCGCVVSERAIKEVKSEICHKCGKLVDANDVVILNGSEAEVDDLREKMTERRKLAKMAKKKKKAEATSLDAPAEKKAKIDVAESTPSTSVMLNGKGEATTNGKAEATTNGKMLNGKAEATTNGKSEATTSGNKTENLNVKSIGPSGRSKYGDLPQKAQSSYSIAKDSNASEAYKSLFTTHKNARNQVKAHWVTHNPCFY